MFRRLQEFPLLMGLSKGELMRIVETMDLDFRKLPPQSVLARQGERCDRLCYLLGGKMDIERTIRDGSDLVIAEQVTVEEGRPFLIEPCRLWGIRQLFARTYTLPAGGSVCMLRKAQVASLVGDYPIVRTNMLSMACNAVQRGDELRALPFTTSAGDSFRRFVRLNALTVSGPKRIKGGIAELAEFLSVNKVALSNVLHAMADRELLTVERKNILIHDTEKLLST